MRFSIFAAIAALSVTSSVHAENWKFIGRDTQDGIAVEFDSLKRTATGARVWTAAITADKWAPMRGAFGNDVQVTRSLYELDCTGERVRELQTTYLTRDMQVRGSYDPPTPKWFFPAPGTVGLGFLQVGCGMKNDWEIIGSFESLPVTVEQYFMWRRFQGAAQ